MLMQRLVAWLQHGMHEAVVEIVRECQCVHRDSVNKIMESEVQRLKINPAQQVFWCDQNVDDLGLVPLCVDTGWQVTHEWNSHNSTGLEITHKVRKGLYWLHSFTFMSPLCISPIETCMGTSSTVLKKKKKHFSKEEGPTLKHWKPHNYKHCIRRERGDSHISDVWLRQWINV